MAIKHKKRCSISLLLACQIKPQWNIISHPLEWTKLKNNNNKCWQWCRSLALSCIASRNVKCYHFFGKLWKFPMKSSLNLSYHLAIPLIPIYQREMKVRVHKKNNVRTFIGALFKIILNWKEPEKPNSINREWNNILCYIHSAIK